MSDSQEQSVVHQGVSIIDEQVSISQLVNRLEGMLRAKKEELAIEDKVDKDLLMDDFDGLMRMLDRVGLSINMLEIEIMSRFGFGDPNLE
jgi:hypothetical protein